MMALFTTMHHHNAAASACAGAAASVCAYGILGSVLGMESLFVSISLVLALILLAILEILFQPNSRR